MMLHWEELKAEVRAEERATREAGRAEGCKKDLISFRLWGLFYSFPQYKSTNNVCGQGRGPRRSDRRVWSEARTMETLPVTLKGGTETWMWWKAGRVPEAGTTKLTSME